YISWRDARQTTTLCIQGEPLQGKSVLSKAVLKHLEHKLLTKHTSAQCKVIYFFCFKQDERYSKSASIMRSLIIQLLSSPLDFQYLPDEYREMNKFLTADLYVLWRILKQLLENSSCDSIYCIVDALDECDDVVEFLQRMSNTASQRPKQVSPWLKLLFTTRPMAFPPEIGLQNILTLKAANEDVRAFIATKVLELECDLDQRVSTTLIEQAGNTFFWISIIIKELKLIPWLDSEKAMKCIEETPKEFEEMIQNIASRLIKDETNKKILAWVAFEKRPLSVQELDIAIATDSASPGKLQDFPGKVTEKRIIDNCGTLLRVHDSHIYLVHQSVKDYFDKVKLLNGCIANRENPELYLAEICTNYLKLTDFEKTAFHPKYGKYALINYASRFWYQHIRTAEEAMEFLPFIKLFFLKDRMTKLTEGPDIAWEYYGAANYIINIAIELECDWLVNIVFSEHSASFQINLMTTNLVKAAAGGANIFELLLDLGIEDILFIAKDVVKAAAGNWRSGKEVMMLLLEKQGYQVQITLEVVKAAAGNWRSGKEVMMLLLEERGDQVQITREVVKAAAENWGSGKEIMMLLFEKRESQVQITPEIVKAAAGNSGNGKEVIMLLLEERGDQVQITPEVVKAAVGNSGNGKEIMMHLLEKRGDQVQITPEVVEAAAGNSGSGEEILMLLFEKRESQVQITPEVVKAAAGNSGSGKEILMLLFEKRGDQVQITPEVVEVAAGNWGSGKEILMLLFEKRGDQVQITPKIVEAAAGNWGSGEEIMMLLFEKRGDQVRITPEVVEAAAGNWGNDLSALNVAVNCGHLE
ncbi:hypothetical protein B0O99DRAFT_716475, partial [Bisporella sp. PMI_857]